MLTSPPPPPLLLLLLLLDPQAPIATAEAAIAQLRIALLNTDPPRVWAYFSGISAAPVGAYTRLGIGRDPPVSS
jgi:hypothetical protein